MNSFWKGFEKAASAASEVMGRASGMTQGATNFLKGTTSRSLPKFSAPKPANMPKVTEAPKRYTKGTSTTPI